MNADRLKLLICALAIAKAETSCETNIIRRLFDESESLTYVMNGTYHHSHNPKFVLTDPHAIDVRMAIKIHTDYVILAENEFDLLERLYDLQVSAWWHAKKSPKRRYLLFLQNVTDPQMIFDYAQINFIVHLLIVRFRDDDAFAIYRPQTYCDDVKYATETCTCNDLSAVRYESSASVLRGCLLDVFVATALTEPYSNYKKDKPYGLFVRPLFFLQQMHDWKMKFRTSSIAFQFAIHTNAVKDINGSDVFVCEMRLNITDDHRETTDTILFDYYLWLMPIPRRKSNVKVLATIFDWRLWLLLMATLCAVASINSVADAFVNGRRDLQRSFLQILALNLGVGVRELSASSFYRVFLVSYIAYSLHLNYFYQGKLSATLTAANYERRIRNVEELYASNLKLIAPNYTRLRWMTSNNALAKKFAEKVTVYVVHFGSDVDVVNGNGSGGVALLTKSLKTKASDLQKVDYIRDTLTLTTEYAYGLLNGSYYTPFFNDMIRITNENGFLPKWTRDISARYKLPKLNTNATLTFEHLTGAFVILATGLGVSILIFVHEMLRKNVRTEISP